MEMDIIKAEFYKEMYFKNEELISLLKERISQLENRLNNPLPKEINIPKKETIINSNYSYDKILTEFLTENIDNFNKEMASSYFYTKFLEWKNTKPNYSDINISQTKFGIEIIKFKGITRHKCKIIIYSINIDTIKQEYIN